MKKVSQQWYRKVDTTPNFLNNLLWQTQNIDDIGVNGLFLRKNSNEALQQLELMALNTHHATRERCPRRIARVFELDAPTALFC